MFLLLWIPMVCFIIYVWVCVCNFHAHFSVWTGLLFWCSEVTSYGCAALLPLLWFGWRKVSVLNRIDRCKPFSVFYSFCKRSKGNYVLFNVTQCNALSKVNVRYFLWVKCIRNWVKEIERLILPPISWSVRKHECGKL